MTLKGRFPAFLKDGQTRITVGPGKRARAGPLNNRNTKGHIVLWERTVDDQEG